MTITMSTIQTRSSLLAEVFGFPRYRVYKLVNGKYRWCATFKLLIDANEYTNTLVKRHFEDEYWGKYEHEQRQLRRANTIRNLSSGV